jgi:hypothetical protein
MGEASSLGILAASWPSPGLTTDGDGHDVPMAKSSPDADGFRSRGGMSVKFQIGDRVQEGTRVGTVTDVGTVLIQVKSDEGRSRVVCPWELVKVLG